MSLSKTYRLGCDVSELLMDRELQRATDGDDFSARLKATRKERQQAEAGCRNYSVTEYSAAQARRSAKSQGWIRHSEDRPIYGGSDQMTTIKYDLCPVCGPKAKR